MSVTSPVAIVDAIMTDLVANAGLPVGQPKTQRKYAEPTIVNPAHVPLLAVWCEDTDYVLASAGIAAYERVHNVMVGWYVYDSKEAQTGGTGDPAVVAALDTTIELLIAQIESYSMGVPGIGAQLVSTIRQRSLRPQEGSVWEGVIALAVEETV